MYPEFLGTSPTDSRKAFVLASHWGCSPRPPLYAMLALPHEPWLGSRLFTYFRPWPRLVKPTALHDALPILNYFRAHSTRNYWTNFLALIRCMLFN